MLDSHFLGVLRRLSDRIEALHLKVEAVSTQLEALQQGGIQIHFGETDDSDSQADSGSSETSAISTAQTWP